MLIFARKAEDAICSNPDCDADALAQEQAEAERLRALGDRSGAVVYYIQFGDRVKIGTTVDLRSRLRAVPHDVVLAIEPGGYEVEAERHRQFVDSLIPGQREWFALTPALREHLTTLYREHPELWRYAA